MVFGEENRLFLHGLESVLDQLPGLYNPVVIIGPSGSGIHAGKFVLGAPQKSASHNFRELPRSPKAAAV